MIVRMAGTLKPAAIALDTTLAWVGRTAAARTISYFVTTQPAYITSAAALLCWLAIYRLANFNEDFVRDLHGILNDSTGYITTARNLADHGQVVPTVIYPSLLGAANSTDRKSTRLNSSHIQKSRMPSSA